MIGRLGIRGQIVLLLVTTQVLAFSLTPMLLFVVFGFEERRLERSVDMSEAMLSVLSVMSPGQISGTSPQITNLLVQDDRFAIAEMIPATVEVEAATAAVLAATDQAWTPYLKVYPLDESVKWPGPPVEPFGLAVALADGSWLTFTPRPDILSRTIPLVGGTLVITVLALPVMLLSIWAGSTLVAPILRLSAGVEAFSRDIQSPDLDEDGAKEVRRATAAFNRMQQKLRKLITDRSQTLAAIGHDMRTPLTRLRLRLENIDAGELETAINDDLNTLEKMIDDALRFMRSDTVQVELGRVDLAVLCRTVCDAFTDQEKDISYSGPDHLVVTCDTTLMQRVLENVVGNAVVHAGAARVTLIDGPGPMASIEVSDQGCGIPQELQTVVLEPFSRLEAVKAGGEGSAKGFGLGLAIANDLMTRQGGSLALQDNEPTGLIVCLQLPKETPA